MFADPQTLTINAVAVPMARVGTSQPGRLGNFRSADEKYDFSTRQDSTNQRFRREVRLTLNKVAADPISAVNKQVSCSVMIVIDEPKFGVTDTEIQQMVAGLSAWFTTANQSKLLVGEL